MGRSVKAGNLPPPTRPCPSPFAIFTECPMCDGPLRGEHAHFRCTRCGWRDSCCD